MSTLLMAGGSLLAGIAGVLGTWVWLDRRLERRGRSETAAREDDEERRASAREAALHDAAQAISRLEASLTEKEAQLAERSSALQQERDRLAGMTRTEARREVLERMEQELRTERARRIRVAVADAEREASTRARDIVLTAIQRLGVEQAVDAAVSRIALPTDDVRGRIIGREGRNIRAFEAATGCDLLIDDPPGFVAVSSFDGVRRAVARRALERLLAEGRMQPERIEEVVAEERTRTAERILAAGRAAATAAGVPDLDDDLVEVLGRLHYRTSYGQNVLRHVVEVAHLAALMAAELGLDPAVARRAGLLHDLGKALDQEAEGSHGDIAARLLRARGEADEVVGAVEGHHLVSDSLPPYTALTQVADAISAARPGARRENAERFVARARELEQIATAFEGVEQAYVVQAGRALRVLVDAEALDDEAAAQVAFDLARSIEAQIDVQGEIRVTVIRETRTIEIAQ